MIGGFPLRWMTVIYVWMCDLITGLLSLWGVQYNHYVDINVCRLLAGCQQLVAFMRVTRDSQLWLCVCLPEPTVI